MKVTTGMAILLFSVLGLSGCAYLRSPGPCLGYGCRGFVAPPAPQSTSSSTQSPASSNGKSRGHGLFAKRIKL